MAEDALQNLPEVLQKQYPESILLTSFPQVESTHHNPELAKMWEPIMEIRDHLNISLESARKNKVIGRSMEAQAYIYHESEDVRNYLSQNEALFRQVFILSKMTLLDTPPTQGQELQATPQLAVSIDLAEGEKCERCWGHFSSVGVHAEHPTLCQRCTDIVTV